MARKTVAITDVLANGNWFPKGTGFSVVDTPDAKAKPPEVDVRTANAWEQYGFAERPPVGKAQSNAD